MAGSDLASAAGALGALIAARSDADALLTALAHGWAGAAATLGPEATALGLRFAQQARTAKGAAELGALGGVAEPLVTAWAASVSREPDLFLAPLLARRVSPRAAAAARARTLGGPLADALACLGASGEASWLAAPEAATTRARLDLLLWEAGARALVMPELGAWLWREPAAFEHLIRTRMRGCLRERVLAARTLAIAADGMPPGGVGPALEEWTVRAALGLWRHPEPLVWIPAARAIGRLQGRLGELARTVKHAQGGLARRAITVLGCVPGHLAGGLDQEIQRLVGNDPWALAALGPALPYFATERRELWQWVVSRIMAMEEPAPEVVWSMTHGLTALARRDGLDRLTEGLLRAARDRALHDQPREAADAQLWRTVVRETDFLDELEQDPGFPDVALDRAVADAVRLGAGRAHERAQNHARAIAGIFGAALARARGAGDPAECGQALASAESALRAAALGLWLPIAEAAGRPSEQVDPGGLAQAAAGLLDVGGPHAFALRRTALRTLGLVVDATAAPTPGQESARGRALSDAVGTLAGAEWAHALKDERREASRHRKTLQDLFWRLDDAAGLASEGDDVLSGPVLAWWTLCGPAVNLAVIVERDSAPSQVVPRITGLRRPLVHGHRQGVLASLAQAAPGSALAHVTTMLFDALDAAQRAVSDTPEQARAALEFLGEALAHAAVMARDPVSALAPATELVLRQPPEALLAGAPSDAERSALAERFSAAAGPGLASQIAPRLGRLLERLAAPPAQLTLEPGSQIGPYHLLRRLGAGGQGQAWLVEKEAGGRAFVMKIPVVGAVGGTSEVRESLASEAALLRRVHSLHVASFVDHGWDGDTPYMVLQYLRGASLDDYVKMRPLSLEELQPIVADVCIGLRELHALGIVHRDLKPSNVFLQLALPPGNERFEPAFREPAVAPLAGAVLIDFGIAGLAARAAVFAGTLGFVAPEQVMSDPPAFASDVYGLAATVFWALTGRSFFDTVEAEPRWHRHGLVAPFDDAKVKDLARELPRRLTKLLAQATVLEPAERPTVAAFAAAFQAL